MNISDDSFLHVLAGLYAGFAIGFVVAALLHAAHDRDDGWAALGCDRDSGHSKPDDTGNPRVPETAKHSALDGAI